MQQLERDVTLRRVEATAARFLEALSAREDLNAAAVGHWTVGEVAAHLVVMAENYAAIAAGRLHPAGAIDRLEAYNDTTAKEELRPLPDMIELISQRLPGAVGAFERHWDEEVEWMEGIVVPVPTLAAMALGEFVVHGFDVSADRSTWRIAPLDSSILLLGLAPVAPHYVDESAASGFNGTIELRIRRGARGLFAFDDGRLTVRPGEGGGGADCFISGDSTALILVMYGRLPPLKPALTGKILAWGRKPWLGLRFPQMLKAP